MVTSFGYSSIFFTLEDGYPRLKTAFATKTEISAATYPYTGEEWPTYTGIYPAYPDCLSAQNSAQEASLRKAHCGGCTVTGEEVQLNYWPVNAGPVQPNRTITPKAVDLVTAVVNGATFTSPTVYVSIERVYAMDGCNNKIGKEYPSAIIGLKPDALSSWESYDFESRTARPVNYEELYENLPASRWFELEGCQPYGPRRTEDCLPIRVGRWPTLVVPDELRDLDPEWKSCNLTFGLYDPPRILVPAHVLVSPTVTADPSSTASPAVVAPGIQPPGPAKTARPKPGTHEPLEGPPIANPPAKTAAQPPANDPPVGDPPAKSPPVKDIEQPPAEDPTTKTLKPGNFPPDSSIVVQFQVIHNAAIITLGPQIYTVKSATDVVIGSKTILAGGAAATISGEVVSLGANGLIVGGEVHAFSAITSVVALDSPKTLAVKLYTGDDKHIVVIGSATLSSGGIATIAGEVISVGNNGVVLNGKTRAFSEFQTLGSFWSKVSEPSNYDVPFRPLEKNGGDVSFLIVNGETLSPKGVLMFTPVPNTRLPTIVVESRTLTVDSAGRFIFNSQTFTPDNLNPTSRRVISLAPTASPISTAQTAGLPAITFDFKTYTADSASRYFINGQTLSAGSSITVSGTVIFAPTPALALPTITIGSQTYIANSAGQYIIAGKTLTRGGGITVSGTTISLDPSATALVIGDSTVALAPTSGALTPGLGSLIMQGFAPYSTPYSAPYSTPSSNFTGQAFLGSARRIRGIPGWCITGILGLLPWLMSG